ncbi:MAG: preprotein translocase subunit SecG [Candidatus Kapabacteria bacterium]|nr:preprotein translocase subunit SecG [Candidatus Kapabacteria bacterium]
MVTFLSILLIISAILLIVLVLLQPGKGDVASSLGMLSGQFNSILGTRRATDLLQKLTIGFAAGIMVVCLLTNVGFVSRNSEEQGSKKSTILQGVDVNTAPSVPSAPSSPGAPQQQQQQNNQQKK